MGGGGGREWHPTSAARLHGVRLSVADTGVCVPQVGRLSKGEEWVWQGTLSQVGGWICPECRGQRDGGCGQWGVLTARSVFGGAVSTSDGRRR